MSYRNAPESAPLILLLRNLVVALDPERGTRLWQQRLRSRATRMFLVGPMLFITEGSGANGQVSCFDVDSGAPRGSFLLSFEVTAGITRGDRLILAGHSDAVCITTGGGLVWSVTPEVLSKSAWDGEKRALVCRDASSTELWRVDLDDQSADTAGLLLGDLIAQPDLRDG